MTLIRLIIFTVLMPGSVAWWIPSALSRRWPAEFDITPWNYSGIALIIIGALFYFRSAVSFLLEGKGTPAIWFTKPIGFLLGEEPSAFVSGGLYTRTRNPMYLGVFLATTGEVILLQKVALIVYVAGILLLFHLVITFLEEPHLRRKYGQSYETYLQSTPRWFSLKRKG